MLFSPIPASVPLLAYAQSTPRLRLTGAPEDRRHRLGDGDGDDSDSEDESRGGSGNAQASQMFLDGDMSFAGGGRPTPRQGSTSTSRIQVLQAGDRHEMHVAALPIEIKEELLGLGQYLGHDLNSETVSMRPGGVLGGTEESESGNDRGHQPPREQFTDDGGVTCMCVNHTAGQRSESPGHPHSVRTGPPSRIFLWRQDSPSSQVRDMPPVPFLPLPLFHLH
jgi:hypothetical protein